MKKILSGVLAAASLLTMTVSASAATNEKKVAAAGEVEYDVAVTAPKVVLDLVMPAKMEAQLNPYGADIKLDSETTPTTITNGIAGVAYKIENKTEDYGVYIDATATTTVTRAVKTETWTVKEVDATKKSAELALVGGNTVAEIKAVADAAIDADDPKAIASAAVAENADDTKPPVQGALVMDSTVAAVTATKTPAGQTKQKKMMFIGAESEAYMAFVGNLGTGEDDEWAEDDAINVALVLKVVAGPKAFSGAADPGNGGSFTATVNKSAVSWSDAKFVVGNLVANDTYAATFDATDGNVTPTFTGKTLDDCSSSATTVATVRTSDGRISPQADGKTTIKYDFTDGTSISFEVTITNA